MENLAGTRSCRDRRRRSICVSRRRIKRPLCWIALTFLVVTAIFLPVYSMLPAQQFVSRCLVLAGVEVTILLAVNLLLLKRNRQTRTVPFLLLVLLTAAAAVMLNFFTLERSLAPVRAFQGDAQIEAEILDWDVTDYGSKYLVRTTPNSQLPQGIKARMYSFGEPVGETGDRIRVTAPIKTDVKGYDLGRGVFFYLFAEAQPVELIQDVKPLREKILAQTVKLYDDPVLGMVQGVLFGEKGSIEKPFQQMVQSAGLVHILAVSGIHITLVAAFCSKVFSVLGLNPRITKLLVLLPVWGYISLAQFSPSAVRAGIMTTLFVLGYLLHREPDSLSALAAAALFITAATPFAIYSVSFQLSFLVTLGIVLCAAPLTRLLHQIKPVSWLLGGFSGWRQKLMQNICSTFAASLAATVFSFPVVLYYFHSVSVWGVLAAVLALWAVAPLMILAILSVLAGMLQSLIGGSVLMAAARTLAGLAGLFARWILLVSKAVSNLPGALFYSHELSTLLCMAVWVVLLILIVYQFDKITIRMQKMRALCGICCAVFCFCTTAAAQTIAGQNVLCVFATENAMVLTKDGQGAVIGDVCSSYEAEEIASILSCEGVEKLELLFCDRDSTDESAGVDLLLREFAVKVAVVPQRGQFYAHIQKALPEQEIIPPQGLCAQLLDGVVVRQRDGGAEVLVGEKKLLKNGQNYDIINEKPSSSGTGMFYLLRENPVLKIRMDGKAGTQYDF